MVATLGNAAGALVPWAVARRFGPRFARSRTGRRLLPPELVSFVEREYVRFGLPGIFLCRLLPGIRFIVAPFAGLVGLGPIRTLVPLGLAASVWYTLIVTGGWLIGGQRTALIHFLRGLNVGLAVVGVVVIGAGVWWWIRRRQRLAQAAGARVLRALEAAVAEVRRTPPPGEVTIPLPATALLLVEIAGADETIDPAALEVLESHAKEQWGVGSYRRTEWGGDYLAHARESAASTDHADRIVLAAHIWRLMLTDGTLSAYEAALLDRVAAFLSLTPDDIAAVRRQAGA